MHFKWNYEPPTSEQQTAAKELGEKIGMSPIGERCQAVLPSYAKRADRPVPDERHGHGG